jgi:hypothetical protein
MIPAALKRPRKAEDDQKTQQQQYNARKRLESSLGPAKRLL